MTLTHEQVKELRRPLPTHAVGFRPADKPTSTGTVRCHAYITARTAGERLSAADPNWEAVFINETAPSDKQRAFRCKLTVCGTTREAFGVGTDIKAAESDSLKRAAVAFGVGSFLYSLPSFWAEKADYFVNGAGKVGGLKRGGVKALAEQYTRALKDTGMIGFGNVVNLAGVFDADRHATDEAADEPVVLTQRHARVQVGK